MKKLMGILLTLFICTAICFAGAGKKSKGSKVDVWSYTDEVEDIINNYYKPDNPNAEINYVLIPSDMFQTRLDPELMGKSGTPDVFTLEDYFVDKYISDAEKYLLDLTDIYNEVKDKLVKFPVQVGTHNGKVYAMSWQIHPGAMIYRRSLAKKYLGTDDPAEVQKYFSDWNNFLKTARTLSNKSNGSCVVVSTVEDLYRPVLASRKSPWVVDGKLNVDPAVLEYMEMCKTLIDEGLAGTVSQWSEGWFAGMKNELMDSHGSRLEVFSYFLPTWGLHYVLKPNAPEFSGDWAMIKGPVAWRWGGSWLAVNKNSKNPGKAKEIIKYICTDDSFLEKWAVDTGDVVVSKNVLNKIKNNYSEPYLNGQNHYEIFAEIADEVDESLGQPADFIIEDRFLQSMESYLEGLDTLDGALADFKERIAMVLAL